MSAEPRTSIVWKEELAKGRWREELTEGKRRLDAMLDRLEAQDEYHVAYLHVHQPLYYVLAQDERRSQKSYRLHFYRGYPIRKKLFIKPLFEIVLEGAPLTPETEKL